MTGDAVTEDATGCCAALRKALAKGALTAAEEWTCPKCGGRWVPRVVAGVRLWEFQAAVFVLRRGR